MNKEQHLQKIQDLRAEWARIGSEINKLGVEYSENYSGFKEGQKVIFGAQKENGIIQRVFYSEGSKLPGFAKLQIKVYVSDWSRPKEHRHPVLESDFVQIQNE